MSVGENMQYDTHSFGTRYDGFTFPSPIGPTNAACAMTMAGGQEPERSVLALEVALRDGGYPFVAHSAMASNRFAISLDDRPSLSTRAWEERFLFALLRGTILRWSSLLPAPHSLAAGTGILLIR